MTMVEIIKVLAEWIGTLSAICAGAAVLIKPFREKLFGLKAQRDAEQCILRNAMLQTYKAHQEDKRLTQDEYTNFKLMYDAYTARGGNSFIKRIWKEIESDEWEVVV